MLRRSLVLVAAWLVACSAPASVPRRTPLTAATPVPARAAASVQHLETPRWTAKPTARPLTPEAAQRGESLLAFKGCAGCHGLRGEGGNVAPRIAHTILPYAAVLDQVRLPKWIHRMPAFPPDLLTDDEVQDIYAFLQLTAR